ncbi:hypothetical protein C8Q79DRAFT_443259 [Trametes meyenii]|nr:hypothetical protein C8Q79DRAFT_443259 [Trametes meyenii]
MAPPENQPTSHLSSGDSVFMRRWRRAAVPQEDVQEVDSVLADPRAGAKRPIGASDQSTGETPDPHDHAALAQAYEQCPELLPDPPSTEPITTLKANMSHVFIHTLARHPFQGLVGSQDGLAGGQFSTMCITSPNQVSIPEFPVERGLIKTYADGRWGVHEYSRWPQVLTDGAWHFVCIPRRDEALSSGMREVLWRTLHVQDWQADPWTGAVGLGFLKRALVNDLASAAEEAIMVYMQLKNIPHRRLVYGSHLVIVLRQTIEWMKMLPSSAGIAVVVAAHVQRLALELHGLCTYFQVLCPRLESTQDYCYNILGVVGAFVKEGNAVATLFRKGVPVFFLQPLTRRVEVWAVVPAKKASSELSSQPSSVPIFQRPGELPGFMTLTGNWSSQMMATISSEICSLKLSPLPSTPPIIVHPNTASSEGSVHLSKEMSTSRQAKRPRTYATPVMSDKVLELPSKRRPEGQSSTLPAAKKVHRSGKNKANKGSHATEADTPAGRMRHPSREFIRSAFVMLPPAWARSLESMGIVRQPPSAALYFYPPPFLLDTVSSNGPPPLLPVASRNDEKVERYLHNLTRIRMFCRTRLFDATINSCPMSIADWRTALWGDYRSKEEPNMKEETTAAELRLVKRRYKEKNLVSSIFDGPFGSYNVNDAGYIGDLKVTADMTSSDVRLRMLLLWESHEINFRCELMALDCTLVPREGWPILQHWERDVNVSSVWGKASGVNGILPAIPEDLGGFHWRSSDDSLWPQSVPMLKALTTLMTRWPGCPEVLFQLPNDPEEEWDTALFDLAQQEAARFYVCSFVEQFHRLPIVPFCFPPDMHI